MTDLKQIWDSLNHEIRNTIRTDSWFSCNRTVRRELIAKELMYSDWDGEATHEGVTDLGRALVAWAKENDVKSNKRWRLCMTDGDGILLQMWTSDEWALENGAERRELMSEISEEARKLENSND